MNNIQQWIAENLQYSRGLICKKCKREWFEKYKFLDKWEEIHTLTQFLDTLPPSFPQRIWHIINDKPLVKCGNPPCHNIPQFWSFNLGYLQNCSSTCAQHNPDTINKIQTTNLKKYGCKYGLSNKDMIIKRETTVQLNYGVDNISKVEDISDKKKETCLKNHGVEWFVERQDIMRNIIQEKFGVDNVQQVPYISEKRVDTCRSNFYNMLFSTDRLKNKCVPMFSEEEYVGDGIERKYPFKCNTCNEVFSGWLHDGDIPRCTNCYPSNSSIFEKDVAEYVKSLLPNDVVEENNRTVLLNNRELDIYIPSKNVAIECNGLFWHGEAWGGKDKNYHLSKTLECEAKGIRLIHILEDEWSKKSILVKEKIKYIVGNTKPIQVYGRKCKIVNVSSIDKKAFLNQNHIQGNDAALIYMGLEWENKLVALMTLSSKRCFIGYKKKVKNDKEFELCRYTSLNGYSVIGGAGKLLSYFIKTYKPEQIISYADRRWTYYKDNLYERIGFKKVSDGIPNYWYFGKKDLYRRHHRFGFRKNVLNKRLSIFDANLTEWENMKINGWDRIWDCGNLKYEMVFP